MIRQTVSREEVIEACRVLRPEYVKLAPEFLNHLAVLKLVAEDCFVENLQGPEVDIVRNGLRQLNNTGLLV